MNGHSHIDSHVEVEGISYLHINSASYYWLGGKVRTAIYEDPLFTIMTIDKETGSVTFTQSETTWSNGSPEDVGYFKEHEDLLYLKENIVPKISGRSFRSAALK